jgi:XisH protein
MPAKDVFHETVKLALQKDGWTIPRDPLSLKLGTDQVFIDLGAERWIVASRGREKIAVEVKSFLAPSALNEYYEVLGQFLCYRLVLNAKQPDCKLYLAIPSAIYANFFRRPIPQQTADLYQLAFIVINPRTEDIEQWIE